MARAYARLASAIWDDRDFRSLDGTAQLTYLKLVSQREISMCGVLTVAPHRWAGFSDGTTPKTIERALRALHDARFVVLDLDSGEVLVRTFTKHNDVWRSANTAKAAGRAFGAIHSAEIRQHVTGQVPEPIRHLWPEGLLHTPAKALNGLLLQGAPEDPDPDPPLAPRQAPSEGAYQGASVAPNGASPEAPHRSLPETRDLIPEENPPSPQTELVLVPPLPTQASTGRVDQVFDAWVDSTGKPRAKLDPKRRKLIQRRLGEYPIEDLIDAVRGWRHVPHNRGENDRQTVFNDLELLLRDAAHIEKFRDAERRQGAAPTRRGPDNAWMRLTDPTLTGDP